MEEEVKDEAILENLLGNRFSLSNDFYRILTT